MKKNFLLILVIILATPSFGQKVISAVSESKYVNITKDPIKPPYLVISSGSLQFEDTDGNQKIDGGETAYIRFKLSNSGMGPGLNLAVKTRLLKSIKGLSFTESFAIDDLEPGKSKNIEIPITGSIDLIEGEAEFEIIVVETNGFSSDPALISVQTAPFRSPQLKIVDYKVTSESGTTIQKKVIFDLQVLIQNVGQGIAYKVNINLPSPTNILCLSENENLVINSLSPGQDTLINYSFVATANFSGNAIYFTINSTESNGRFGENKVITIAMGQPVSPERLVIHGKEEKLVVIDTASLISAVDKNIPEGKKVPERLALIIGNENYSNSGSLNSQVNVDFARNDASVFNEYAKRTLGVQEDNIFVLYDGSAAKMSEYIELVSALSKRIGESSEIIFYYAGHGLPDENLHIPYLIPVDVDPKNLSYAIKLNDVYRKFSETGAKRVIVILDACFSGGGRTNGLVASRSVRIVPEEPSISGNMLVLAASSGDQSSLPYKKEKHGIFTYFLLKKLQETKGEITYGQLYEYLKREVGIESLKVNKKEQDPQVQVSPSIENTWKNWMVK